MEIWKLRRIYLQGGGNINCLAAWRKWFGGEGRFKIMCIMGIARGPSFSANLNDLEKKTETKHDQKRFYNFPWHDINTSQITNPVLKKLIVRSGWARLDYNLPRLTLAKWVPNAHAAVHVQNIRFLLGNKAWNAWQCAGFEIKVNSLCLLMPSQRDTDFCSRMEWTRFTKHCKYKQMQAYSTPVSEARKCKITGKEHVSTQWFLLDMASPSSCFP